MIANGVHIMTESNPQSSLKYGGIEDGILIIDKPEGITSHDVVARVRKILNIRRVGHAGTLDPFATGVLVVCVNRATRLSRFLTGANKEYVATMRMGFATDTGDLTGTPKTPIMDASHITLAQLQEAFSRFLGPVKQTPPMYSAKKIGGVKLYEMARRGEEIERAPIDVEIKKLELINTPTDFWPPTDWPERPDSGVERDSERKIAEFSFRVICSSGTYIRTLAEDIGKVMGVEAHLTRLRRIRSGSCSIGDAVKLEVLTDLAKFGEIGRCLVPMVDAVEMPVAQIDPEERRRLSHGLPISCPKYSEEEVQENNPHGAYAKLCDKKNQLIAIAELDATKTLWLPRVVLID